MGPGFEPQPDHLANKAKLFPRELTFNELAPYCFSGTYALYFKQRVFYIYFNFFSFVLISLRSRLFLWLTHCFLE